jgi:hypothetical protein
MLSEGGLLIISMQRKLNGRTVLKKDAGGLPIVAGGCYPEDGLWGNGGRMLGTEEEEM